jgi:hypothetical protein
MSGAAWAQTATTTTTTAPPVLSAGQQNVAERFAAPYATFAGSRENAVALAIALRTGTAATLTYTTAATEGQPATTTSVTLEPPTRPMGWGNVKHALALAQFSLAQAGVTNPTAAQVEAALLGGGITVDGRSVDLAGVLAQRADGMGWGRIAHSYGTTMGAVHRGVRTGTAVAGTTTTTPVAVPSGRSSAATATGTARSSVTTAAGSVATGSGKGLTTAGGSASGHVAAKGITTASGASGGHGAKGLTTASNASAGGGIVTAEGGASRGQGHAYGRGVVTASGGSAATSAASAGSRGASGVTSAAGTHGGSVTTAQPGNGNGSGHGNGQGNGKGKPGG